MSQLLERINLKFVRRHQLFRDAFTLAELLISITILVGLVLLLSQVLSAARALWQDSEARTDTFRDARAALELMTRELSLAQVNDRAPVLSLSNVYTHNDDPTAGPTNNQQIYAIVPIKNAEKTDLCAVGYYCNWNALKRAYVLRRHLLPSDANYTRLQVAGLPASTAAPSAIYTRSGADPAASPAKDEDVAAYIWDLKIVPFETNPTPGGPPVANTTYPVTYYATLPQYLNISFKALSPQAGRQLTGQITDPSAWFATTSSIYLDQIRPRLQTFSTRVRFQNAVKP